MNDKCEYGKIDGYRSAFNCFVKRFLVEKKSIFRLGENNGDNILTADSIQYLVDNFIENGYGGKASFIDKIKHQLLTQPREASDDNIVIKNAIEVLAHIVWLWRLVPSNGIMTSTVKGVKEVLTLESNLEQINLDKNHFFNQDIKGIAKTGTYYNTNKPFEIAFVIKFLEAYLSNKEDKSKVDLLNGIGDISIITTGDLDQKGVFTLKTTKENNPKTASIFNALLFFFEPDNYEAIVSNSHKKEIVEAFKDLVDKKYEGKFNPEIDWKLKCIKEKLNKNNEDNLYFFYTDEIIERWNPSILPAKNVIYYGAPGTGKTHDILALVEAKIDVQCSKDECREEYYEIVQFHPSYSYEDFIDGIKPVKSSNNNSNINLELVDGVFKNICKRAYAELKKNPTNPKQFYFIADEINRAELSRVFGELLLCIEEDKRLKFVSKKLEGVKIKTQNSTLWEKENAVVVVDNDKCNKENGLYFGVPENIYFLATMNDIDKSIDSFDLALRRRFKWVHKGCDYDVIYNDLVKKGVNDDDINTYISDDKKDLGRCYLLNNYINKTLNLGESYELGHSYFMNIKVHNGKIPKNAYGNLFDLELAPLLSEYLRTEISSPKELKDKLFCMKKIFAGEECK